jgi:hypothetical protein
MIGRDKLKIDSAQKVLEKTEQNLPVKYFIIFAPDIEKYLDILRNGATW